MKTPNSDRVGDWIQTYNGTKFWPLDPRAEEISIVDIAHALSLICRFGGHCREFYSVAQHSVIVSDHLPEPLHLRGLLHDAAEAYLGDMVRPLKHAPFMRRFKEYEWVLECHIMSRFGVDPTDKPAMVAVKEMDCRVLLAEKRDLLITQLDWGSAQGRTNLVAIDTPIVPLSSRAAEDLFLQKFLTASEIGK